MCLSLSVLTQTAISLPTLSALEGRDLLYSMTVAGEAYSYTILN